ncbi:MULTISPECIES: hypothetical protein [unclassified Neisseria]|uniref:hypothetical protein n=1 Tax=unclassified Neisseria TaxID=2623750 RepID=UPI001430A95C|nr:MULTISPECIES: hypothetical protein [unclassified Neisseria]MBF0804860.1 hypothetical protein [Neisseria sp. 19428wB4_WF04]
MQSRYVLYRLGGGLHVLRCFAAAQCRCTSQWLERVKNSGRLKKVSDGLSRFKCSVV